MLFRSQALLTEKLVEAVSSENAARFAAMESAHGNVGKKLEQLREEANRVRQDEITMELLDLVTGAEAAGAKLFFVPKDNCADVKGLHPDLRLVKATTMHEARLALDKWVGDHDAALPTC